MWSIGIVTLAAACAGPSARSRTADDAAPRKPAAALEPSMRVDPRCILHTDPDTVREDGSAVLLLWTFPDDPVYSAFVLPADSTYLAYRAAIRTAGAALRNPIADESTPSSEAEATLMRNEAVNRDLAQRGEVGVIEPIRCLDALLFALQHARVSQLTQPSEFLASVLRKEIGGVAQLTVLFGAGSEMFPPKSVYGFDVVEEHVAQGWEYWYALHNHTLQRDGDRPALGAPALSTSDVQLMRSLARDTGLQSARVTNGFYTYAVSAGQLDRLRSR